MEKHNSNDMDLISDIKIDPGDMEISFKIRIKHKKNIVSADIFFQPDQCNDNYCKNDVDTSSVSHLLGVNNSAQSDVFNESFGQQNINADMPDLLQN